MQAQHTAKCPTFEPAIESPFNTAIDSSYNTAKCEAFDAALIRSY
jgi:hypothetical protein